MNGYERLQLDGRLVLVTGAAGGIGQATARLLAGRGARLALCDVAAAPLAALVKSLGGQARCVRAFEVDVSRADDVDRLFGRVTAWGGEIAGLVNNAGIGGAGETIGELTLAQWQEMLAVDLTSVFLCCQAALGHLAAGASIVNIASITGIMGVAGSTPYAAAKAGVVGFSKSLARELAPQGRRVNVVAPGLIDTPMARRRGIDHQRGLVLLPRIGAPEDVAEAIAFLLCDASAFVTGQVLGPNGGAYM